MQAHFESQNHHVFIHLAAMKREIEEIKTHFTPKFDMIKWTVGVGVATVLSVAGIVWNLDARLTQDIRELRQSNKEILQMVTSLAQESKETKRAIADLARETKQEIAALSRETKQEIAVLSKKIDGQNQR